MQLPLTKETALFWRGEGFTLAEIGRHWGISRQAVWARLNPEKQAKINRDWIEANREPRQAYLARRRKTKRVAAE